MDRVLLEDVFKIGGVPTHTFVEPSEYNRLKVALRTAGRGVIVEGPSGIGKSTAVARALDELEPQNGIQTLTARDPGDVGYIELLPETTDFGVVVIDDFHVLQDKTRRDIADLLKRLADTESKRSKLIIVGINRAGDSFDRTRPGPREPRGDDSLRSRTSRQGTPVDHRRGGSVQRSNRGKGEDRRGSAGKLLPRTAALSRALRRGRSHRGASRAEESLSYSVQLGQEQRVMEHQDRRFGHRSWTSSGVHKFRPSGPSELLTHPQLAEKRGRTGRSRFPEEMARHQPRRRPSGR